MGPELVILTGDQDRYIPDNDFMGEDFFAPMKRNRFRFRRSRRQNRFVSEGGRFGDDIFSPLKKIVSGFGIAAPGGNLTVGPGGLQYQSTPGAVVAVPPPPIYKNPVFVGAAILGGLLILSRMKKK